MKSMLIEFNIEELIMIRQAIVGAKWTYRREDIEFKNFQEIQNKIMSAIDLMTDEQ